MRRLYACAAALALTMGMAACGSGSGSSADSTSADTNDPITVGFVVGKTGVLESYDVPAQTMAQLAIEDINAQGGIDGRQIETVEADMKSKPELAGNAATQVISDGADMLLLPCDFDLGSPAALVAQEAGKIGVSLCAASTAFGPQGIGNLAYTMGLAGVTEGAAAAEWAYEDQKWTSTYVCSTTRSIRTSRAPTRSRSASRPSAVRSSARTPSSRRTSRSTRRSAAISQSPAARLPLRLELPARVRGGDQADSRCRDRHPDRRRLGPRR